MSTKKGTYHLYLWENFDYAEFIRLYRHFCANWKVEWSIDETTYTTPVMANGMMDIRPLNAKKTIKTIRALKDDNKIIQKCKYLQHSIIVSVHTKAYEGDKDLHHTISINSSISVEVLGKDFYPMRKALMEMGYMKFHYENNVQRFNIFSYSSSYEIKDTPIIKEISIDATIKRYIDKLKDTLTERKNEYISIVNRNVKKKEDFIKNYNLSLNKINIKDKKRFSEELNKYNYSNLTIYNNYVFNALLSKYKEITKIDYKNNRIYHVLTNLKREYKKYLNIKYSIDSKNSHPLLFNYILFKYYDISLETSLRISNIFYLLYHKYDISISYTTYHYDGKSLYNFLIDNGINKSEIADIPFNVFEYVYNTTNGLLWDDILKYVINEREDIINKLSERHPEVQELQGDEKVSKLRSIIKIAMFAEVFYSHTGFLFKDEDGEDIKPLAAYFKDLYPSVYSIISKFKNLKKCKDNKIFDCLASVGLEYNYIENTHGILPNAMMKLEANIFTHALDMLYIKKYRAVNIHDAIVVPDVSNAPSVEEVEKVLRECYAENGLYPTFSVDYYNI